MSRDNVSAHSAVVKILESIGEDITREGLVNTPTRVVSSWKELFSGYSKRPEEILSSFESDGYNQIVLLTDIELYSTCEHHLLPFIGRAHVAYIPNGRVIGISKLARLVEIYSRRLQIQERIGEQVTDALMTLMNPLGVACVIQAQHLCMMARGVNKQHSMMTTSSLRGVFMDDPVARAELLSLIGERQNGR